MEIQAPRQGPKIVYRERIVHVEKIGKEIVEVILEIPLSKTFSYVIMF